MQVAVEKGEDKDVQVGVECEDKDVQATVQCEDKGVQVAVECEICKYNKEVRPTIDKLHDQLLAMEGSFNKL